AMATFMPSRTKAEAMPSPIPLAPPVTNAFFPRRSPIATSAIPARIGVIGNGGADGLHLLDQIAVHLEGLGQQNAGGSIEPGDLDDAPVRHGEGALAAAVIEHGEGENRLALLVDQRE